MSDRLKRETRQRMMRTGESYTEARRAVAHPAEPDTTAAAAGQWTWQEAADRLDALGAMLRYADELVEHLAAVRALRPPRTLPGWRAMSRAVHGDDWGSRRGLLGAVTELHAALDTASVNRHRSWHLHWYTAQAWELVAAAAHDRTPVQVAALLPCDKYEDPAGWYPPADADAICARAGSAALTAAAVDALGRISAALAASHDLHDWQERIADLHHETCHDAADGECHHNLGPADYELDAWAALEDQAADYEPALAAFCTAARIMIRTRTCALRPRPVAVK